MSIYCNLPPFFCIVVLIFWSKIGLSLTTDGPEGPLLDDRVTPLRYFIDLTFLQNNDSLGSIQPEIARHIEDDIRLRESNLSFFIDDFENVNVTQAPEYLGFFGNVTISLQLNDPTSQIILLTSTRINLLEVYTNPPTKVSCNRDIYNRALLKCGLGQSIDAGRNINITFIYTSYFEQNCRDFQTEDGPLFKCKSNTYAIVQSWAISPDNKLFITTSSEPDGARNLYPSFDEPMFKARFRLSITAPSHLKVFSNEAVEEEYLVSSADTHLDRTNLTHTQFKISKLLPTYVVTFVIGHFWISETVVDDGITWRIVIAESTSHLVNFPSSSKQLLYHATRYYQYAKHLLQFDPELSSKIDLVGIPGLPIAMENPGLIAFPNRFLFTADTEMNLTGNGQACQSTIQVVLAHEIAHQWFGNLVTMRWWNDLWLSEGLSSFLDTELQRVFCNEYPASYRYSTKLEMLRSDQNYTVGYMNESVAKISRYQLFGDGTYMKGNLVVQFLASVIGREVFYAGLKSYFQEFQGSTATQDDFVAHMQRKPVSTNLDTLWNIPLSLRVQNGNVANLITFWLTEEQSSISVIYNYHDSFIFLEDNPDALYSVEYDEISRQIIYDAFSVNCNIVSDSALLTFYVNQHLGQSDEKTEHFQNKCLMKITDED